MFPMSNSDNGQLSTSENDTITDRTSAIISETITHDPILIQSDLDLEIQGFPGNGTEHNPYKIIGLNITTESSCIEIANTRCWVEISQCILLSNSSENGIDLFNVSNIAICDCMIIEAQYNIKIETSSSISIFNVTTNRSNNEAISIYNSSHCIIYDSSLDNGSNHGICIEESSNVDILSNNVSGFGGNAFYVLSSSDCNISNNRASNNGHDGYHIWSSNDTILMSNMAKANWIGFRIGYAYRCNLTLCNATANDSGFYLRKSSECYLSSLISNTNEEGDGIMIEESNKINVTNSISFDNYDDAYYVWDSSNVTLSNNIAYNSGSGFYVDYSTDCNLINNTAHSNRNHGFEIGALNQVLHVYLEDNFACNNRGHGFFLRGSSFINIVNCTGIDNNLSGLNLDLNSYYCNITMSTFKNNNASGIEINRDSDWNSFTLNHITDNMNFGIHIDMYSDGNTIWFNWLSSSSSTNAYDEGVNNHWDDGVSFGNFWDDYDGSLPYYNIPGPSGSIDTHPLRFDYGPPIVDTPDDVLIAQNVNSTTIVWNAYDENPLNYEIYDNDALLFNNTWNLTAIAISTDLFSLGSHNITLKLIDRLGQSATDVVLLVIVDILDPEIDNLLDVTISEGFHSELIWHPGDTNPFDYSILINGSVIKSGLWNSSSESISISLEGLELGIYNYTIIIYDTSGNSASDEVLVTVVDGTYPIIDGPDDLLYEEGTIGNSITWFPMDAYPVSYIIYLDGAPVKSGKWNSTTETISISADGLSLGSHNYTIVVSDIGGNTASDVVIVTVTEVSTTSTISTTPTTATPTIPTNSTITSPDGMITIITVFIAGGGVALIIVIIILKKR